MSIYEYKAGLGNSASYQVSGKPWASGSINVNTISSAGTDPQRIAFPFVTQWFNIRNHDTAGSRDIYLAFSKAGLPSQGGTNHIKIPDAGATTPNSPAFMMRFKVSEIWIEGTSTECDIMAGLTGIQSSELLNNWSGSAGVG